MATTAPCPNTPSRARRRSTVRRSAASLLAAAALACSASAASADQVIPDDLIVQGSLCAGIPCASGEAFGFDTIVVKGDVVGIHFLDTSVGTFPSADWAITANDADGAGEANRFSIEDRTAGTRPFTIEGGAPNDSLHVTAGGSVGVGTATPQPGAALDVNGNLRVDGALEVTGAVVGTTGVKAGIIPKSAFRHGRARVTFATPYAGDYLVLLTAVSRDRLTTFSPVVLRKEPEGFTIAHGGLSLRRLVEVHWTTQPVGE